jgi:hypothetical protein
VFDGDTRVYDELKVAVPPDYAAYLTLGRFRDALLWDAQRRAPDPELAGFLRTYVVRLIFGLTDWQQELLGKPPTPVRNAP